MPRKRCGADKKNFIKEIFLRSPAALSALNPIFSVRLELLILPQNFDNPCQFLRPDKAAAKDGIFQNII